MKTGTKVSRREFVAGAAAAGGLSLPWSAVQPGANPLPSQHNSPLAMWALTGTLDKSNVLRHLDAFHGAGWGVVLYPRWGLELEYLGGEWFERIRFIVEAAAARAMEVWLYDEFNWPSGHAKGLAVRDRPGLEAEILHVEADGRSRVERVPGAANLLLPAATERFLAVTHQRYADAVGEHFGGTVRAMFTDEPSLAIQHLPRNSDGGKWRLCWSSSLDAALGGDFRQRMAGAGEVARWHGWRDYWAAYTQVFHDAWVSPIAQWCRAQRLALSGHLLGEHGFGEQVTYNGSLRRQLSEFGFPGIDEIHTQTDPMRCEALTLSAIAELEGRERMAEVFALGPAHMSLGTVRRMVDLCSACGVDRYVMAICPLDLRGGLQKREYLGVAGPQQPWFREYAKTIAEYVAEAAQVARRAKPLGVPWPEDEELWAVAGPEPKRSEGLRQLTARTVAACREAIQARLRPDPAPAKGLSITGPAMAWSFRPAGLNSIRLEQPVLTIQAVPARAEVSVQAQWVRSLRLNGTAVDWSQAPVDQKFDFSYRRVAVASLLREGENRIELEMAEPKPLKFLPALILWGEFAVDPAGRLVSPPPTVSLGDWRSQGYPALCGTGVYTAAGEFASAPKAMVIDSGGYPVRVRVNGKDLGGRAWEPFGFDLRGIAHPGRNEFSVEVTSTLGHLFVAAEAPPVGLFGVRFEC